MVTVVGRNGRKATSSSLIKLVALLIFVTWIVLKDSNEAIVLAGIKTTTSTESALVNSRVTTEVRAVKDPQLDKIFKNVNTWPYRRFDNFVDSSNQLIVLIASCPYLDFLDNIVESMKAVGVQNYVIVPMDTMTYDYCIQLLPPSRVVSVPPFAPQDIDFDEPATFGTKRFKELTASRPLILTAFLEMGYTVFYTDLDVFWKQNILNVFQKDLEQNKNLDMIAMVDKDEIEDGFICSCYLYFRPNPTIIQFLQLWKSYIDTGKYGNDQYAIYEAYKSYKNKFQSKVYPHDNEYFPSGRDYVNMTVAQKDNVYLMHNNWIRRHPQKLERFKEWNAWRPSGNLQNFNWTCASSNQALKEKGNEEWWK